MSLLLADSVYGKTFNKKGKEKMKMKRSFSRIIAFIFTIALIIGLTPLNTFKVEAATKINNTLFYISDFKGEKDIMKTHIDQYTKEALGSSVTSNTSVTQIYNNSDFISKWNAMPDNQFIVVINTHGTPTSLDGILSTSGVSSLKWKNISYIVLLGCNCGHYDYRTNNIARTFAERFGCSVIASDGTVKVGKNILGQYNGKNLPQSNQAWKDYCTQAGSNRGNTSLCYGWLVYVPKNVSNYYQGKLYQIGRCNYTIYDLIRAYAKTSLTSLPVK